MAKKKRAASQGTIAAKPEGEIDIAKLMAAGLKPVDAPIIYAATIAVQATSTDISLIFSRARPAMVNDGKIQVQVALAEVTGVVQMSQQAFKDLVVVCTGVLQRREEQFGEIHTEFTRKKAAEEAEKQKKLQ